MVVGISVLPLLFSAVSLHISVISVYYYVQSPVLGLLAGVLSFLDIVYLCRLFAGRAIR